MHSPDWNRREFFGTALAASDYLATNGTLTLNGTLHVSAAGGFGAGTYTFRARLRNTANNAASGYSG